MVIDVNGVGYEVFVPATTFSAMPECRLRSLHRYPHACSRRRSRAVRILVAAGTPRLRKTDHDFRHRPEAGGHDPVRRFGGGSGRCHQARRSCAADVNSRVWEEDRRTHRCRIERQASGFQHGGAAKPAVETDVLSALENLGYSRAMAEGGSRAAPMNGDEDAGFEVLFKRALQILTKE